VPAHRFAAAASVNRGLALLTPGFCELEWTEAGDLLFTVLRAVGQLSRGDLPTRPGHAGWPEPTPLAQCLGQDRLDLALVPVSADDVKHSARLHTRWEDAFLPVAAWWLRDAVPPLRPSSFAELDSDRLVVSAVKPASGGEGVILRCYNPETVTISAAWRFASRLSSALRVRADEREPRAASLIEDGHLLPFEAAPGEWVTHLVR
jgi:alpha-mannosidase